MAQELYLGVKAELQKAKKGTPEYEEWLRKYREKRHGKADPEAAKEILSKKSEEEPKKNEHTKSSVEGTSKKQLKKEILSYQKEHRNEVLRSQDVKDLTQSILDSKKNETIEVGGHKFKIEHLGNVTRDEHGGTTYESIRVTSDLEGNSDVPEGINVSLKTAINHSSEDPKASWKSEERAWAKNVAGSLILAARAFDEKSKNYHKDNSTLEKAKKGTPEYDEWLRKYREKRHGKGDSEAAKEVLSKKEDSEKGKTRAAKDLLSKNDVPSEAKTVKGVKGLTFDSDDDKLVNDLIDNGYNVIICLDEEDGVLMGSFAFKSDEKFGEKEIIPFYSSGYTGGLFPEDKSIQWGRSDLLKESSMFSGKKEKEE